MKKPESQLRRGAYFHAASVLCVRWLVGRETRSKKHKCLISRHISITKSIYQVNLKRAKDSVLITYIEPSLVLINYYFYYLFMFVQIGEIKVIYTCSYARVYRLNTGLLSFKKLLLGVLE